MSGLPKSNTPNLRGLNHSVEFICDGINYSNYLTAVRITNTNTSAWPQVAVSMNATVLSIILEKLYGQKDFILRIRRSWEGFNNSNDVSEFYLTYMESGVPLHNTTSKENTQMIDRVSVTFLMIPTYAINVMGAFVNIVMDENSPDQDLGGGFLMTIFKNIVTNKLKFKNYELDDTGINKSIVDQLIIPPMSLKQAIDYLDKHLVFYESSDMFRYCDAYGKLLIWGYRSRLTSKDPIYTIYHFSSDLKSKKVDELIAGPIKNSEFYTPSIVETLYHANSNILSNGHNVCYLNCPDGSLYDQYNFDLSEASSELKLPVIHHDNLTSRKKYIADRSRISITAGSRNLISEAYKRCLRLRIILSNNIDLNTLVRIGEPMLFKPLSIDYQQYQGKYLIESSDIVYERNGQYNWKASAKITLFRPNLIENNPGE